MRRLEFVDSLRGLAAMYVAIYHTVLIPHPNLAVPRWAEAITLSGGTAVTLFFVVSAFSLCQTMHDRKGEPHELLAFFIRRFFRIAPLFYAMIVLTFVRDWTYFGVVHRPWECVKSALFIFNLFPGSELGFVWASWTVGVEMLFYVLFPILFRRLQRLEEIVALFFTSLLGALLYHELVADLPLPETTRDSFFTVGFLRHLPVFVFGMVAWKVFVTYVRAEFGTAQWARLSF
jgi:peptidoglycan/LPS O-acetylase OafA/YrhL